MGDTVQPDTREGKVPVVVFADFVCPWSYIVQDSIDQLARDYDVEPLLWKPHWLHPETPPEGKPIDPAAGSGRRKAVYEWLKELEPQKAERMRPPDKQQYSFLAFEGLTFAEDHGKAMPFKTAVFDALWVDGENIAEVSTLQRAADKAGLDAEELGRSLYEGTLRERTMETVMTARRCGITKTPTMILGRTMIPGYHYYEVMQTVLEKQGFLPKSGRVEA